MAQGLSSEDALTSIDGSKVKIEQKELLSADSEVRELLFAILTELREIKLFLV